MKWTLDSDQLRSVEIGLRGKLRAAQFPEVFIRRNLEDLIQQALTEYARAQERGVTVISPGGWIVHTAYRRAIDQVRKEQRERGGVSDDVAARATDTTTPLPDEEALSHIQAEQLHRAIGRLSTSQRQALSLYYFDEQTTRQAAESLGWSEPTFRRRRDAAVQRLREHLGVTVPEFDIGLVAWLSLTASESRFGWATSNIGGTVETVRAGAVAMVDRTREFATRIFSSGGGETAIGIASPAGKTAAGICAAAVAACTVTSVVGPGIGGIDLFHKGKNEKPGIERQVAEQPPPPPTAHRELIPASDREAQADTPQESGRNAANNRKQQTRAGARKERTKQAKHQATSQFGVESEATAAPVTTAPPAPPPASNAPATSSSPTPDQAAQQQFGLP